MDKMPKILSFIQMIGQTLAKSPANSGKYTAVEEAAGKFSKYKPNTKNFIRQKQIEKRLELCPIQTDDT